MRGGAGAAGQSCRNTKHREIRMGGGGGIGKGASVPSAPLPPEPPMPVETGDAQQQRTTREQDRRAALQARGAGATLLTGALGDSSPAGVQSKTLLGQ